MRKNAKTLKNAYFYKKNGFVFRTNSQNFVNFRKFLAKKCEFVCEILRILQTIYIEPVRISTNLQIRTNLQIVLSYKFKFEKLQILSKNEIPLLIFFKKSYFAVLKFDICDFIKNKILLRKNVNLLANVCENCEFVRFSIFH